MDRNFPPCCVFHGLTMTTLLSFELPLTRANTKYAVNHFVLFHIQSGIKPKIELYLTAPFSCYMFNAYYVVGGHACT